MATVLGSGPIHVYAAFGLGTEKTGADATYYGTTREGPDITEQKSFYGVKNDLSGPALNLDEGFAGREDIIALVATRWLETLDQAFEHFLDPNAAVTPRGRTRVSDRGTLMIHEKKCIVLWLVKAGASRAANVAAGMAQGRKYHACVPIGPDKPIEGNKENMRVRVYKAMNIPDIANGDFYLFDESAAAFTGLPAVS